MNKGLSFDIKEFLLSETSITIEESEAVKGIEIQETRRFDLLFMEEYRSEALFIIEEYRANLIDIEEFYKHLPERATWTPSEIHTRMASQYSKLDIYYSLLKHGCFLWDGKLAVFTKHPIKWKGTTKNRK